VVAESQPTEDMGRALDHLRRSVEKECGHLQGVYEAMCCEVAQWVEDKWSEIGAVADRLGERGCLRNWEVHRVIWETCGTSEPPTDRPFGDLLEQWDKDELEEWRRPGGWLHELMDDVAPSARTESEDEEV
jgi:hypothetical protein